MSSSGFSDAFVVAGEFNLVPPAPTNGQRVPLQVDAAGNWLVNIAAGTLVASNPSVGATGATAPTSATEIGVVDALGKLQGVSLTNPLPVVGSIGGTQYADGVTQITPTGTIALGKNPTNILHALGLSAAGNLNVNLAEGTITGGNAAASATSGAVPVNADYQGVNIGGNLVGVTGLALGATTKAPTVAIVDGSGNQITSFGGGTQFADNAASGATPTGTLEMGWDSANSKIRALKVDASQNLNVNVQASAALSVTFPSAQHVIVDSLPAVDVTDRAARLLGHVTVDNATLAVTESGAWNVNQTIGVAGFEKITDGTNTAAVKAASTAAVATDTALVVAVSPNNSVAVTGTFFQATQPVSIAAAVDVSDRAARLLGHVTVDNATLAVTESGAWNINQAIGVAGFEKITDGTNTATVTAASALKVDGSGVTQPVSGTFFQATQPVSIAAAVDISDRAARLLGHVTVDNATLAVTQSTSPWVENVSQFGGNPVVTGTGVSGAGIPRVTVSSDSFPATQPISAASLPLPANAAQETSGNLATLVTLTRNDAQMLDVMASILSQMKMLNLNLATCIPGSQVDGDTILLDTFPTN